MLLNIPKDFGSSTSVPSTLVSLFLSLSLNHSFSLIYIIHSINILSHLKWIKSTKSKGTEVLPRFWRRNARICTWNIIKSLRHVSPCFVEIMPWIGTKWTKLIYSCLSCFTISSQQAYPKIKHNLWQLEYHKHIYIF